MSSDSDSYMSERSRYIANDIVDSDSISDMQSEEELPIQEEVFVPSGKFGEKVFGLIKRQGISLNFSQSFPQDLFKQIISEGIMNYDYLRDYFDQLQEDLEGRGFYALALKEYEEFVEETEGVLCFEYYRYVLPLLIRLLSEYPETQEVLNFYLCEAFSKHAKLSAKIGGLTQTQFI